MPKFIQIGAVIINVKNILDIKYTRQESDDTKYDISLTNVKLRKWEFTNFKLQDVERIKRELLVNEPAEKLRAIKYHIEYKRGRMSESDRTILDIIKK